MKNILAPSRSLLTGEPARKHTPSHWICVLWCLLAAWAAPSSAAAGNGGKLVAHAFDSGFPLAHDSYNGVSCASDGKIYYVLCTSVADTGAQMYAYDPTTGKIAHLGDLTAA